MASAQRNNQDYKIKIHKIDRPVIVDGLVDSAWRLSDIATDFYMVTPMDTSAARVKTEVRMLYDDENIYLLAHCFHAVPGPYIVESLKRDFIFPKNDNFLLFMDPFDDQTNGFSFGANAAGAQWDGIMFEGGKVDLSWDNKWSSAVKNYDDKWVFELAIPFKTIRYKKGIVNWGINFSRMDLKTTEKSSWAPVPRQFPTASLAYTGILVWDQPPPDPGVNISFIPYALAGLSKDHLQEEKEIVYRKDFGADAKIAVTSSLNMDLTVNPDFSQVDVDRQVTNLDRFELFFPERRQFFLENGDLFANFGYQTIRPFFSRRIGLGVPIEFGARLSGRINKDWRIGAMDMQTERISSDSLPAHNFAVITLQRRAFTRSNISAMFVNKESIHYDQSAEVKGHNRYNRNAGIEYNLASVDNLWTGKALFLKSFTPGKNGHDWAHGANIQYASRTWNVLWQHEYVGRNYNAEVGYVPRQAFVKLSPMVSRLFFPKSKRVLSHGPRISSSYFFNEDASRRTDNETLLLYQWTFRSQSVLAIGAAESYIRLLRPFDPTNTGLDTLATNTTHRWLTYGFEYFSKPQSLFTYGIATRHGGYYANGSRLNINTEIGYRFQPFVSLAVSTTYNYIQLPEPWGKRTLWLIGPRIDVTMTNMLFFTAFAQYNQQQQNVNLNTRLQWRYKPASDLFIVYTDNYFPEDFHVKNRALVLKLTYWWNL